MKRILVALDSSPRSPIVLEAAIKLARATGGKLRLFRSVGIPPEIPSTFTGGGPSLTEVLLEGAKKELDERAKDVPPELLEGVYTHVNTPWDGICRAAKEHDADIIVIGSHGYGAIDRILGTTAAKVVNRADRNVLVVKTGFDGPPAES